MSESIHIGSVILFSSNNIPDNFLLCDGKQYDRNEYPDLYNVIEYQYGGTDPNFSVPNYIGRVSIGADQNNIATHSGDPKLISTNIPQVHINDNGDGIYFKSPGGIGDWAYDHGAPKGDSTKSYWFPYSTNVSSGRSDINTLTIGTLENTTLPPPHGIYMNYIIRAKNSTEPEPEPEPEPDLPSKDVYGPSSQSFTTATSYTIYPQEGYYINVVAIASGGNSGIGGGVNSSIYYYSSSGGGGSSCNIDYKDSTTPINVIIDNYGNILLNENNNTLGLNRGMNGSNYNEIYSSNGGTFFSSLPNDNISINNIYPGNSGDPYYPLYNNNGMPPEGGDPQIIIENYGKGSNGIYTSTISDNLNAYFQVQWIKMETPTSRGSECTPFPINYVPDPPRLWSREQYGCPPNANDDPLFYEKLSERRKAEIFKYKNNANNMSKKQQYANISRGRNYTGKQSWATQTSTYTDPNVQTDTLKRSGDTYNSTLGVMDGGVLIPIKPCAKKNCAMSYENDTPGPARSICLNPSIQLYNFNVKRTYRAGGGKWPYIGGKPWKMALYRLQAEK